MLNCLKKYFPPNAHYLILQKSQDEINSYFLGALFAGTQFMHKKDLWGKASEKIPQWGKQLGWVPDHFSLVFLSETVELEIAEALALKHSKYTTSKKELSIARSLLNKLGISELKDRNPFFLSEGETKMVWLLSQWAKLPQYLIIGNLPLSLSKNKLDKVLHFLLNSNNIANKMGFVGPTIILGCHGEKNNWYHELLSEPTWQLKTTWTELMI